MTQKEKLINLMCYAKRDDPETGSWSEWLADYLLDNGVVVLPCNVGDKVYVTIGQSIMEYTVYSVTLNDFWWATLRNKEYCNEYQDILRCIGWDLGKTIFLAREEAEAALKGRKE